MVVLVLVRSTEPNKCCLVSAKADRVCDSLSNYVKIKITDASDLQSVRAYTWKDENPTLSPKYLLSETVVTDAVALGGTKEMTMADFEAAIQEWGA